MFWDFIQSYAIPTLTAVQDERFCPWDNNHRSLVPFFQQSRHRTVSFLRADAWHLYCSACQVQFHASATPDSSIWLPAYRQILKVFASYKHECVWKDVVEAEQLSKSRLAYHAQLSTLPLKPVSCTFQTQELKVWTGGNWWCYLHICQII